MRSVSTLLQMRIRVAISLIHASVQFHCGNRPTNEAKHLGGSGVGSRQTNRGQQT